MLSVIGSQPWFDLVKLRILFLLMLLPNRKEKDLKIPMARNTSTVMLLTSTELAQENILSMAISCLADIKQPQMIQLPTGKMLSLSYL